MAHVDVSISNPPITIPPPQTLSNVPAFPNLKVKAAARIALPSDLVPPRVVPKAVEKAIKVIVPTGGKVTISWTIDTGVLEQIEPLSFGTQPALEDCIGSWLITNTDRLGLSDLQWVVDDEGTTIPTKLIATPNAAVPSLSPITSGLINPDEPVAVLEAFDISVRWMMPRQTKKRKAEEDANDHEDVTNEPQPAEGGSQTDQPFRDPREPHTPVTGSPDPGDVKRRALEQIGDAMQKVMRNEMIRRFPFVFDADFLDYHSRLTPPASLLTAFRNFAYTASQHRPGFVAMCGAVLGKLESSQNRLLKQRVQSVSALPSSKRKGPRKRHKADGSSQSSSDSQQQSQRVAEEAEAEAQQAAVFERAESYLNKVRDARNAQQVTSRVKLGNILTESLATVGFLKWTESRRGCIMMECPEVDYFQGPITSSHDACPEESLEEVGYECWEELPSYPWLLAHEGNDENDDLDDDPDFPEGFNFEEEYELEDSPHDTPALNYGYSTGVSDYAFPSPGYANDLPFDMNNLAIQDCPPAPRSSLGLARFQVGDVAPVHHVVGRAHDCDDELEGDILWDNQSDDGDCELNVWTAAQEGAGSPSVPVTDRDMEVKHPKGKPNCHKGAASVSPRSAVSNYATSFFYGPGANGEIRSYDAGPCAVLSQAMDVGDSFGHGHRSPRPYHGHEDEEDDLDADFLDESQGDFVCKPTTANPWPQHDALAFEDRSQAQDGPSRVLASSTGPTAPDPPHDCSWDEDTEDYAAEVPFGYVDPGAEIEDQLDDDLEGLTYQHCDDNVPFHCDDGGHLDASLDHALYHGLEGCCFTGVDDDLEDGGDDDFELGPMAPATAEGWSHRETPEYGSSEQYDPASQFDGHEEQLHAAADARADVVSDGLGAAHRNNCHGDWYHSNELQTTMNRHSEDNLNDGLGGSLHNALDDDLDDGLEDGNWHESAPSHARKDQLSAFWTPDDGSEFCHSSRASHRMRRVDINEGLSSEVAEDYITEVLEHASGGYHDEARVDADGLDDYCDDGVEELLPLDGEEVYDSNLENDGFTHNMADNGDDNDWDNDLEGEEDGPIDAMSVAPLLGGDGTAFHGYDNDDEHGELADDPDFDF